MRPVLFTVGSFPVSGYAVFVALGILAAALVRRREVTRLGYTRTPGHAWIGVAALAGAMLGSKLGMLLFVPPDGFAALMRSALAWDFTGKTVVGGIAGGYLGVEAAKRVFGIRHSTGDAFAVSLPLAQGIGRIGCFLNGCCGGIVTDSPLAIAGHHPTQLYESGLDLLLAASLWAVRTRPRPAGHLFRLALVGYGAIRFGLEFLQIGRAHV